MATALEQLLALRDAPERFDTPPEDLLGLQMEAANERLESRVDAIPLLRNRVDACGATKVVEPADLVPLLFAHNTYKSYGETWLGGGQWDRMARWLQTVSTVDLGGQSFADAEGLDDWIERIQAGGDTFVACSSGTTGRPAMLPSTSLDIDFGSSAGVSAISWSTGVPPRQDRRFFGLGPRTAIRRNESIREALLVAFQDPGTEPYQLPVPMITTGAIMAMILLRRKIVEGTAVASEVAEFEALSTQRMSGLDEAMADAVDNLIASRDQKLLLGGMWASVHPLAVAVRERGFTGSDFSGENAMFVAGGLKGASLPDDYREVILDTFGITDGRVSHVYSMQEINSPMPRCAAGRYHVPPWLLLLPLDATGEQLLETSGGPVEGRAAFFDLSLVGRWGGITSGDKVTADFGPCACGHQGPTVGPDIVRYADLDGGDKIACAGTIDAYVKGAV